MSGIEGTLVIVNILTQFNNAVDLDGILPTTLGTQISKALLSVWSKMVETNVL